ncbi:MAG: PqqD family protein [Proteobacteria bacterium]|nr:MAG: PqqD family protein [Pseudomonadota bacterium]
MSQHNPGKEFLHSLHPILPDAMRVKQNAKFELDKIPCCYLLKNKDSEEQLLKLNDSGVLIWQLCHEERAVGEIVDLLAEAFEQARDEMARDVSRVVSHLLEEDALLDASVNDGAPAG